MKSFLVCLLLHFPLKYAQLTFFIFVIILIIYSLENNRSVKTDYVMNNRGDVDYVKIPSIACWVDLFEVSVGESIINTSM